MTTLERYHGNRLLPEAPRIEMGPATMVRAPARLGIGVIAAICGAFFVWGAWAPLAGGAIAPGAISPDGSVRTVQHLEGGIVAELYVKDGSRVEAGTPLLALERIAAEAGVTALADRRRARLAEQARIDAELAGKDAIHFPADLTGDADGAAAMTAEQRIFEARRTMIDARRDELGQQIQQLQEQIGGYEAQVASATDQLALIGEEVSDKDTLLKMGLAPKADLLRLRRAAAELGGFKGQYTAAIAAARQQIGQAKVQLLALDAERMQEGSQRASEIRTELNDIDQSLAARRDVLNRTVITSPVAGIVNNMRIKTKGGVVGPGAPILDIVPTDEKLVIDVAVSPMDIDQVEVGMPALVHLSALAERALPRVEGVVTEVSAERLVDPRSGQGHYLVRIEVAHSALVAIGDPRLSVGMPAEAIIVSKERTMVEYLMEPIMDALRRAGREV